MTAEPAAHALLDAITRRDPGAVGEALTPDARVRALLPSGLVEIEGAAAFADRLDDWFGGADPFVVLAADAQPVADRMSVRYRLRLRRPGTDHETVIEQSLVCSAANGRIDAVDLVCSGFLPLEPPTSREHAFDAGSLGCADGLTQAFKNRIKEVDIGDLLRVHTVDPSAKEDLPALARLMGHAVRSVEAHTDGGLTITVERGR